MMTLLLVWVYVFYIEASTGLTRGRNAKLGEFLYIVRIAVTEDLEDRHHRDDHIEAVATGVLVNPTRIVTTCDAVGSFAGQTIRLYNLSRVSVMGGSVASNGEGGKTLYPNFNSAHPYCYSLVVTKTVLFNYGIYTIPESFNHPYVAPIENTIHTHRHLERALRRMWEGRSSGKCVTASWGNPKKQFTGRAMPDRFERFSKVLQTTSMDIVDYPSCYESTCINFASCLTSIWECGFICAKAPEGGPCEDDNGAPLVCSGQLFAIHTNPQDCKDKGLPRHFLRIDLEFGYVFGVEDSSVARETNAFAVIAALLLIV